jgi:hypothetical protein
MLRRNIVSCAVTKNFFASQMFMDKLGNIAAQYNLPPGTPMSILPEQFSAARDAQLTYLRGIASTAVSSTEEILALNMSKGREAMATSTAAVHEILSARDPRDLFALAGKTQLHLDGLLAYGRALFSIASSAQVAMFKAVPVAAPTLALVATPAAAPAAAPTESAAAAPVDVAVTIDTAVPPDNVLAVPAAPDTAPTLTAQAFAPEPVPEAIVPMLAQAVAAAPAIVPRRPAVAKPTAAVKAAFKPAVQAKPVPVPAPATTSATAVKLAAKPPKGAKPAASFPVASVSTAPVKAARTAPRVVKPRKPAAP